MASTSSLQCCSLCASVNPPRRKSLTEDNSCDAVDVLTELLDPRLRYSGCELDASSREMILEGFVCYACFKVLNTYYEKRKILLNKLETVVGAVDMIEPTG